MRQARSCKEQGVELWRRLHIKWVGRAPHFRHAKARKYQAAPWWGLYGRPYPRGLLGGEIRAASLQAPDWLRTSAIEKLVPNELLSVLVSRPELDTHQAKLHWVGCWANPMRRTKWRIDSGRKDIPQGRSVCRRRCATMV